MRVLLIVAALLSLVACGLKDDLYLPEAKTIESANTPNGETPSTPERSDSSTTP
jgi:predicted small lipoprotein YifL